MNTALWYAILGYLSGSILYAKLGQKLLAPNQNILSESIDHNPGVYNAFVYGGWKLGLFALVGDFFKAFIPVYLYLHVSALGWTQALHEPGCALVIMAPVLGHVFPVFFGMKGGKGITASFGSLAALLPIWQPVISLALIFLLFTLVFNIKPDYWKTLVVYVCLGAASFFWKTAPPVVSGVTDICLLVLVRLALSREPKQKMEMLPFWERSKKMHRLHG